MICIDLLFGADRMQTAKQMNTSSKLISGFPNIGARSSAQSDRCQTVIIFNSYAQYGLILHFLNASSRHLRVRYGWRDWRPNCAAMFQTAFAWSNDFFFPMASKIYPPILPRWRA
jgi:hypothetical protein